MIEFDSLWQAVMYILSKTFARMLDLWNLVVVNLTMLKWLRFQIAKTLVPNVETIHIKIWNLLRRNTMY